MKKILLATAILCLAASSAFAATFSSSSPLVINSVTILKPSNNVNGEVINGAASFSAIDKHLSGSRNFAASSTETKLYWVATSDANKGTTTLEISLSASDTSDFAGWTAL